jgi:Dolichyl-phosphate-mannose-protein mannosyltransferase
MNEDIVTVFVRSPPAAVGRQPPLSLTGRALSACCRRLTAYEQGPATTRGLLLFLAVHITVWTVFGVLTLGSGSLHHDMTEAWAWGQEFQLGYHKHPPFFAWVVGVWFKIIPRADWSFYLLSMFNAGVGLAGVWMIAGRFLDGAERWSALLLVALTPFFSFSALRYNANSALLGVWPWTIYFFVRSLETRRFRDGALAGFFAALTMLTKYYSLVLIGTCGAAALLHPDRRSYFRSLTPCAAIAVGLATIAPHLMWAVANDYPTFKYALEKMSYPVEVARERAIFAVLIALAYNGVAAIAFALAFGVKGSHLLARAMAQIVRRDKIWLGCLALGPLLLTIAAHGFVNVRISTAFMIPDFFMVPIALLALSRASAHGRPLAVLAGSVGTAWLLLTLAAPMLGYISFLRAKDSQTEPHNQIAAAATDIWHRTFGRRLDLVGGEETLATALSFYSTDAPSYMAIQRGDVTPWVSPERLKASGILIACRASDVGCRAAAQRITNEKAIFISEGFASRAWGREGQRKEFIFILQPPT